MMGFTLPSIDVPITKSVNCIMAPGSNEIPRIKEPSNCIRCGRCARVCPSRLVPYQMYNQSKAHNHAAAQMCGIKDCTLCGCCTYVCPSYIPLTAQFRYEKAVEKHIYDAEIRNERAKQRMETRNVRLAEEEKARAKKKAEALARMKAQKEAEKNMSPEELAAARQKAIEEAKAKARERKAALMAAKDATATAQNVTAEDSKEALTVKRIKDVERKAMMVAKHQGHIETSILPKKDDVETKVAKAQAEVVDVLPYALRTQAGVRDNVLNIKANHEPVIENENHPLVGLEPDDSLQNPAQKKVIAQVLLSHQEQKVENNTLPQALKKKTLRAKR